MYRTKNLSVENFNEFIRCLTNLKEVCNDADIREGILRQRTNNQTSIFEIDFRPLFDDMSIALTNLKQKLELLKTFQGQSVDIIINQEDDGETGSYIFKDQYSSINFICPTMDFMDNKYLDEEELRSIFPASEDHLILEKDFSHLIADRIRIVTSQFNIESILIEFGGEEATITAATPSKDQSAKFAEGILMNEEIDNSLTHISSVAFSMDHEDEIRYKMFKDPRQNVSLSQFQTEIGDVEMTIYSRSEIIERDET